MPHPFDLRSKVNVVSRPLVDFFDVGNMETGLSTTLAAGEALTLDAIRATKLPLLDVLPAGPVPPNPAELLGSASMRMDDGTLVGAIVGRGGSGGASVSAGRALVELTLGGTERASQLWKLRAPEEQQHNGQDDQDIRAVECEQVRQCHGRRPLLDPTCAQVIPR